MAEDALMIHSTCFFFSFLAVSVLQKRSENLQRIWKRWKDMRPGDGFLFFFSKKSRAYLEQNHSLLQTPILSFIQIAICDQRIVYLRVFVYLFCSN